MIEFSSFSFFEKNKNVETFIIIFESMKNSESMITDLINRSFSHYFIDLHADLNVDQNSSHLRISLKNESLIITIVHTDMKNTNLDSYAYVMTLNRYISEKFYEVMIDSSAFTKSTVEYNQYSAFKNHKIDSSIDLNHTKSRDSERSI